MVRRGSVGSASACWKAGPSSIPGSAPQGGLSHWATSDEEMERGLGECIVWMWWMIVLYECYKNKNKKLTKRVAYCHQTFNIISISRSRSGWNANAVEILAARPRPRTCEIRKLLSISRFEKKNSVATDSRSRFTLSIHRFVVSLTALVVLIMRWYPCRTHLLYCIDYKSPSPILLQYTV